MQDEAVRTDGLTKHFGTVRAVEDLDLAIERGEVFGYLGPNGAGKTTSVRLLLDFLRPTRGRAVVLGGSGGDPAIRRRIGYLPGDLRLDPSTARPTSSTSSGACGAGSTGRGWTRCVSDPGWTRPVRWGN